MDRESIRESLVTYLEDDLGEKLPSFGDEVNIREELGLDSVDVVSLVMQIERQFRVRLESTELEAIVTVGNLLDLLQSKVQQAAAAAA